MKHNFKSEILCDEISNDPDDTLKARKFYNDYWRNTLKTKSTEDFGDNGLYRGETLNTIKTTLGLLIRVTESYTIRESSGEKDIMPETIDLRLKFLKKCDEIPNETLELLYELSTKYHTLANFLPFPRKGRKDNLNLYKNITHKDFVDEFLKEVKNFYEGKIEKKIFNDKENLEYFKKFGNFKNYIEQNYLDDYLDDNGEIVKIRPETVLRYTIETKNYNKQETIEQLTKSIKLMINLIEKRAERLKKINLDE